MNKFVLIILASASVIGIFYLFGSDAQKDKITGLGKYYTDERQCFRFHRENFNDSDSAYVIKSYKWSREDENFMPEQNRSKILNEYHSIIRVKTKAKNAFGSYRPMYIECPLVNGRFNMRAAKRWQLDLVIDS